MSEHNTTEGVDTSTPAEQTDVEKEAFLARLGKESAKRKEAEKELAAARKALEERETEGLPELERLRKDFERAQKRADEESQARTALEAQIARSNKERLVTAAAQNFNDPGDAAAFIDLDGIEDERDAERAVKALAKQKPHLLKSEETKLPGKVLADGQRVQPGQNGTAQPSLADTDREFASDMLAQINQLRREGGFRPGGSL